MLWARLTAGSLLRVERFGGQAPSTPIIQERRDIPNWRATLCGAVDRRHAAGKNASLGVRNPQIIVFSSLLTEGEADDTEQPAVLTRKTTRVGG